MCILNIGHFSTHALSHTHEHTSTFQCYCKRTLDSGFMRPACVLSVRCWPTQHARRVTITKESETFFFFFFFVQNATFEQHINLQPEFIFNIVKLNIPCLAAPWNQLRLAWLRRQLSFKTKWNGSETVLFDSNISTHNITSITRIWHTCALCALCAHINTNIFSWLCLLF